jgi:hypothetical protein
MCSVNQVHCFCRPFSIACLTMLPTRYWFTNFAQPLRYACEPPPGATGLASSVDGKDWARASSVPLLDTLPAHGAQPWEQIQIYAPNLVVHDVRVPPVFLCSTKFCLDGQSRWILTQLSFHSIGGLNGFRRERFMTFTMPTLGVLNNLGWLRFRFLIGLVSTAQAFATRRGNGTKRTQYYRTVVLMVRAFSSVKGLPAV